LTALTDRLLQLAAAPELRTQLGLRGRAFVREHFAVEKMVADTRALYLKLAAERGLGA
jgi:glycosyltransferase involved in cell wall biosynthesis